LRLATTGCKPHVPCSVAKRLSLVVCDYFERVELTTEDTGVRVLPVLSWTAVERIAESSSNLSDSVAFKRAVLSRPEPITAAGDEQIIPPLRTIEAMQNPQPRWQVRITDGPFMLPAFVAS
jgi:hypothetical protein